MMEETLEFSPPPPTRNAQNLAWGVLDDGDRSVGVEMVHPGKETVYPVDIKIVTGNL